MTLQVKYKKLENDCFNLLTVDPNPPHDINHFSRFLRLENTTCLDDGDRGNFGTAKSCRAHQREESLRSGAHSRECRRTAQGLAGARRRIPEESLSRRAGIADYLGDVEIRGRKRESKIR